MKINYGTEIKSGVKQQKEKKKKTSPINTTY